ALMQGDGPSLAVACAHYCPPERQLLTNVEASDMGHDPKAGRAPIAEALAVGGYPLRILAETHYRMDVAANDWQGAARDAEAYIAGAASEATIAPGFRGVWKTNFGDPWLAEAKAHTG